MPIPAARVGARSVSTRKRKTKWGNGIAEIEKKKKKKLAIVAMPLPKMGGKKIVVDEITCEELKKKKVLRLQYFYNIFTINHK